MQFFTRLAALAVTAATLASANTITFLNQDETKRTLVITPSIGHQPMDNVEVNGMDEVKLEFPQGWIGNIYAVCEGKPFVPGMLAEVAFNGWQDKTYFDVSAIIDANDHDGVKQMYPAAQADASARTLLSGCEVFPCASAYYLPDDIQTVVTEEHDLITTLGNPNTYESRSVESPLVSRNFVTRGY